MNDDDETTHEPLHSWIEPHLEARIVALVLGEASDFEREQLEELIAGNAELELFRKRMEAVHALLRNMGDVTAAGDDHDGGRNDEAAWKLSDDRRAAVLAVIEQGSPGAAPGDHEAAPAPSSGVMAAQVAETGPTPTSARRHRWSQWVKIAAVVVFFIAVGSVSFPVYNSIGPSADYAEYRAHEADSIRPALQTPASEATGRESFGVNGTDSSEAKGLPSVDLLSSRGLARGSVEELDRRWGTNSPEKVGRASGQEALAALHDTLASNAPAESPTKDHKGLYFRNESLITELAANPPREFATGGTIDATGGTTRFGPAIDPKNYADVTPNASDPFGTPSTSGRRAGNAGITTGSINDLLRDSEDMDVATTATTDRPETRAVGVAGALTEFKSELKEEEMPPIGGKAALAYQAGGDATEVNFSQDDLSVPALIKLQAGQTVATASPSDPAPAPEPAFAAVEELGDNATIAWVEDESTRLNLNTATGSMPLEKAKDSGVTDLKRLTGATDAAAFAAPETKPQPGENDKVPVIGDMPELGRLFSVAGAAPKPDNLVTPDGSIPSFGLVQQQQDLPEKELQELLENLDAKVAADHNEVIDESAIEGFDADGMLKTSESAPDALMQANAESFFARGGTGGSGAVAGGATEDITAVRQLAERVRGRVDAELAQQQGRFDEPSELAVKLAKELRDTRAKLTAGKPQPAPPAVPATDDEFAIALDAITVETKGLERSATEKENYDESAYDQTRARFLSEVSEEWESARPELALNQQIAPATAGEEVDFDIDGEMTDDERRSIRLRRVMPTTSTPEPMDSSVADNYAWDDAAEPRFDDSPAIPLFAHVPVPAAMQETLASDEAFSTFSLHVSDVSFKLALAALSRGEWPDANRIRIEEFVNAFDYGDPMPSEADRIACRVEQSTHPFLQQRNLLRIAMRTAATGRSGSTPLRLTLLLDTSGSMERPDRQETVRRAFDLLVQQLQPTDQVTLISFARQPRLVADQITGDQNEALTELVAALPSEGGTNLEAALDLAFEKAQEQKLSGAGNRIVLLTDGAANLGNAKPESLARKIESMRSAGIAFDAAGIGADGLNDEVLEALTRKGDGRYYLLDQPGDADEGFVRQIAGALRPAAKNVKVQVEFNPKRVGRYQLLGFEKHRLEKEDFRNDRVDAAEMAAAEAGVGVYQFEPLPDGEGEGDVGAVSVRFQDMATGRMVEKRWPIPYEPAAPSPDRAEPSQRLATASALFAAHLKGDSLGEIVDLESIALLVAGLPESMRETERVQQLQEMIATARQLSGG